MVGKTTIQRVSVTEKIKHLVVAHEPETAILHPGEMAIVRYQVPQPDDKELEWQKCGKTQEGCLFVAGPTRRKCGLDFFVRQETVLHPIKFRTRGEAFVACGQRSAAKEREG